MAGALRVLALLLAVWWLSSDLVDWSRFAADGRVLLLAGYAAVVVSLWRLVPGALLLALIGVVSIVLQLTPLVALPLLLTTLLVAASGPVWLMVVFAVLPTAWVLPQITDAGQTVGVLALVYVVTWGPGLVVRGLRRASLARTRRIARLQAENVELRTAERTHLARELHDVVGHQLSLISLEVLAYGDDDDVDQLDQALVRVDAAARAALTELRTVVSMLGEASAEQGLDGEAVPTRAAASMAETLAMAGVDASVEVAAAVDHEPLAVRRTVCRLLQETTTNMIRYADRAVPAQITVESAPVRLKAVNGVRKTPASALSFLSLGHGLRGVRERVELLGGRMSAGLHGSSWIVEAELPNGATR